MTLNSLKSTHKSSRVRDTIHVYEVLLVDSFIVAELRQFHK